MKVAQIANGIVVNVAEVEPGHIPDFMAGWPQLAEGVDIGWHWDGEAFSPPPGPTPEELLAAERATMVCSRRQGKIALGPEVWAQVEVLAADPEMPWALRVAVHDTVTWYRLDQDMDVLIWAMDLTPEEADDLFRLAMTL